MGLALLSCLCPVGPRSDHQPGSGGEGEEDDEGEAAEAELRRREEQWSALPGLVVADKPELDDALVGLFLVV